MLHLQPRGNERGRETEKNPFRMVIKDIFTSTKICSCNVRNGSFGFNVYLCANASFVVCVRENFGALLLPLLLFLGFHLVCVVRHIFIVVTGFYWCWWHTVCALFFLFGSVREKSKQCFLGSKWRKVLSCVTKTWLAQYTHTHAHIGGCIMVECQEILNDIKNLIEKKINQTTFQTHDIFHYTSFFISS